MASDCAPIEGLLARLVANPADEEALLETDRLGPADPRAHALLLERVGNATDAPPVACLWLSRAAAVWSGTLGDAARAARVLVEAIHRDPTQRATIRQLAQLAGSEGGSADLAACVERSATAREGCGGSSLAARTELAALQSIARGGDPGSEAYERFRSVLTNDRPSAEVLDWAKDKLRGECNYQALREVLRIAAATPARAFEARKDDLRELAGLCWNKLCDAEGAIDAWKKVVALDPADREAQRCLWNALEESDCWDDLALLLERSAQAEGDVRARAALLERLGGLRERLSDAGGAAEAYAGAAEIVGSLGLWQEVERCSVSAKSWNRAAQAAVMVALVAQEKGDRSRHLLRAAEHLGAAGDQEGSVFHLELAAEMDPTLAPRLADAYEAANRWGDLVDLVETVGADVSDAAARIAMRRTAARACSVHLADAARAREMWRKVLEDGDDREALEVLLEDAIDRDDRARVDSLILRMGGGPKLEVMALPEARESQVTLVPVGDDDVIDVSDFAELLAPSSGPSLDSQPSF